MRIWLGQLHVVLQGTKNCKNAECNVFQVKRLTGARYVTCALPVP